MHMVLIVLTDLKKKIKNDLKWMKMWNNRSYFPDLLETQTEMHIYFFWVH